MDLRATCTRQVLLALACIPAVALLSSCGGGGDANSSKTYDSHGISFEYPGNWKKQRLETSTKKAANEIWELDGIVLTKDDVISIQAYKLTANITPAVFRENEQDIVDEVLRATEGHDLLSEPEITEVAALPTVAYDVAATSTNGADVRSRVYFIFRGEVEYFINCQATEKKQDAVDAACQRVVDTFAIE